MTTLLSQLANLLLTARALRATEVHSLANVYEESAFQLVNDIADPDQFDVMAVSLCDTKARIDVRVHTLVEGVMRHTRHNVLIPLYGNPRLRVTGDDSHQQKPYLLEVFTESLAVEVIVGV